MPFLGGEGGGGGGGVGSRPSNRPPPPPPPPSADTGGTDVVGGVTPPARQYGIGPKAELQKATKKLICPRSYIETLTLSPKD